MRFTKPETTPLWLKWCAAILLLITWALGSESGAVTTPKKATVTLAPRTIGTTTATKVIKTTKAASAPVKTAKVSAVKSSAKSTKATKATVTPTPKAKSRTVASSTRRYVAPTATKTASPPETTTTTSSSRLAVSASKAMVVHENTGETLFGKNIDHITPIASLTKLMTAMVVLDRNLPMDDIITIADEDIDRVKHSRSRLQVDTTLTRRETLLLALMSSENRAAASLARTYPGGTPEFVAAMNRKARDLGMYSSHFVDATGLYSSNVSTAEDLVKMVRAARHYETIHQMTTTSSHEIGVGRKKQTTLFINTNRLVRGGTWDIGLSKTGYINEAGHCLVMQVRFDETPAILVLLGNSGKHSCPADAMRIRSWLQRQHAG